MEFEVELFFEGVVDRFDELADRLQQVLAGVRCAIAVGRTQQPRTSFGQECVQLGGDVSLVGDDEQADPARWPRLPYALLPWAGLVTVGEQVGPNGCQRSCLLAPEVQELL
nr:hypothetical protein [Nonomuraea aridisoli]